MVLALVRMVVLWLNNFPPKSGVSTVFSPRQIVIGSKLDMKKHCKAEFGAYAQVHHDRQFTNTMGDRTDVCICMGLVDNVQGSIYFLRLATGEQIV